MQTSASPHPPALPCGLESGPCCSGIYYPVNYLFTIWCKTTTPNASTAALLRLRADWNTTRIHRHIPDRGVPQSVFTPPSSSSCSYRQSRPAAWTFFCRWLLIPRHSPHHSELCPQQRLGFFLTPTDFPPYVRLSTPTFWTASPHPGPIFAHTTEHRRCFHYPGAVATSGVAPGNLASLSGRARHVESGARGGGGAALKNAMVFL